MGKSLYVIWFIILTMLSELFSQDNKNQMWESLYTDIVNNPKSYMEEIQDITVTFVLADLNNDKTPELLIYNRVGAHMFCMLDSIYTIEDNNLVKVQIDDSEDAIVSESTVYPYYVKGDLQWLNNIVEMHMLLDTSQIGYDVSYSLGGISKYEMENETLIMRDVFSLNVSGKYTEEMYGKVENELKKYVRAKDVPYVRMDIPVLWCDNNEHIFEFENANMSVSEFFETYKSGQSNWALEYEDECWAY